jgi:hypothetical protein
MTGARTPQGGASALPTADPMILRARQGALRWWQERLARLLVDGPHGFGGDWSTRVAEARGHVSTLTAKVGGSTCPQGGKPTLRLLQGGRA